jgi:hypothetical protein
LATTCWRGRRRPAAAWGDAVPADTRERAARKCARRLSTAGLIERREAA